MSEAQGKNMSSRGGNILSMVRPLDLILILGGLGLAAMVTLSAFQGSGSGATAWIETPSGPLEYSLDHDQILKIQGSTGVSTIRIAGGKAEFLDSPCRDKICVHAGTLSHPGDWTACMPNRIFLTIHGSTGNAPATDEQPDAKSW